MDKALDGDIDNYLRGVTLWNLDDDESLNNSSTKLFHFQKTTATAQPPPFKLDLNKRNHNVFTTENTTADN